MDDTSVKHHRQPISDQHAFSFGIVSLRELTWSIHSASIIDIGREGFRIETTERIEPGFLWFRDQVRGNRGGVLEWSRPHGGRFRAEVRFVPLSWNVERYVHERARRDLSHRPHRDPSDILNVRSAPNKRAPEL